MASGEAGGLQAGQMAQASTCLAFLICSRSGTAHTVHGTRRLRTASQTQEVAWQELRQLLADAAPSSQHRGVHPITLALSHLRDALRQAQPALHWVTWQTGSPETLH